MHAKGVEDTAFYRWNRFVALNEVGGDPARFSLSVAGVPRGEPGAAAGRAARDDDARHEAERRRARPADSRSRLIRPTGRRSSAPRIGGWRDPNEAYLILQTVVGAWPLTAERLELYLEKALREAKVNTSWIDQDHEWEAGAKAWAVGLLADEELGAYAERLSRARRARSCSGRRC